MAGLYRLSNLDILGTVGRIPHRPLCDCWYITVFLPGTCQRNCKQIFLAINNRCNNRSRPWHMPNQFVLNNISIYIIYYIKLVIPWIDPGNQVQSTLQQINQIIIQITPIRIKLLYQILFPIAFPFL